ncbi:MAG TPA: GDYXXLXY domain-containing protein [Bacteroidia bacterium]|nr:GDYXXLXY domain-containing protein [Bacteroidia bacterium]
MKKILLIAFVLMALLQLAVPLKMVLDQEKIIATGIEYKFRIAPVDPYDAFRGRYITLNFDKSSFEILSADTFVRDESIYICLKTDSAGFADIKDVSKTVPAYKTDYVSAKVNYFYDSRLAFNFPFNKYYMEETKAPEAEKIYRDAIKRDTIQNAYALVSVKDGQAVLKDVIINGVSIKTLAAKHE